MSTLIEEKDVTAVNLSIELERAVIEHQLEEDNSIYINEDGWFPIWVRVQKRMGFIGISTNTHFRKATTPLQRLEICNEINKTKYMVTAYINDGRLCFDYALNFRDGLLRENFIRVCRQFSKNIEMGLRAVDPDDQFVLSPGQTEPDNDPENNTEDRPDSV